MRQGAVIEEEGCLSKVSGFEKTIQYAQNSMSL